VAVTDGFISFVVDQLDGCGPITWKRMFGGVGIYAADVFFAILSTDTLYLKVDETNRADFERLGSGPFRPYGDDTEVMQYYNVPTAVLEDADALTAWARKAIAVAVRARTKKKTKSTGPRTPKPTTLAGKRTVRPSRPRKPSRPVTSAGKPRRRR
jgi:DNA transformation protein